MSLKDWTSRKSYRQAADARWDKAKPHFLDLTFVVLYLCTGPQLISVLDSYIPKKLKQSLFKSKGRTHNANTPQELTNANNSDPPVTAKNNSDQQNSLKPVEQLQDVSQPSTSKNDLTAGQRIVSTIAVGGYDVLVQSAQLGGKGVLYAANKSAKPVISAALLGGAVHIAQFKIEIDENGGSHFKYQFMSNINACLQQFKNAGLCSIEIAFYLANMAGLVLLCLPFVGNLSTDCERSKDAPIAEGGNHPTDFESLNGASVAIGGNYSTDFESLNGASVAIVGDDHLSPFQKLVLDQEIQ